jgi:lysophospholipase L1-like esterase
MSKIKKILFPFIIVISFFILAEGIARFFYRPDKYRLEINGRYGPQKDDFYVRHKNMGWIFQPGYDGYPEVLKKINRIERYQINSQGLRDKEFPFQKENGVIRIFCSGDSITMGSGSNNEETYPKALERYLNAKLGPKKKFEVINGGIGDYNAYQEYLLLQEIGVKYDPDIVILQYYSNDGRKYVPTKKMFLEEGLDMFYSKSAFIYFIDRGIRRAMMAIMKKQWEKGRARWQPRYKELKWRQDKAEIDTLIDLADKDWGAVWKDVGWDEAKQQLDKFINLSKEKNFIFVVFYFPVELQVTGIQQAQKHDLYLPEKQIRQYCLDNNVPFVSLVPVLKKEYREGIFVDHCHYTAEGAEIVARYMGDSLMEKGILTKEEK